MTNVSDPAGKLKPPPLMMSRKFAAPRALVFQAWSTAEHMNRWFSPAGFSVPEAEVDFRPGGICAICMRSPDGHDFWSRGEYIEIVPPERLVFFLDVPDKDTRIFTAHTTVTFADDGHGTVMTVHQAYDIHDPSAMDAIGGAPEGWRTTLDKLEMEVAAIQHAGRPRSVAHGTFRVQRTYPVTPSKLFRALTDIAEKERWFSGDEGYVVLRLEMDVRPGGRECLKGRWPSGMVTNFEAIYFDVVPDERLVYAYEMYLDDQKISVSLATVEVTAKGDETLLAVTEQGAFLDGYDDARKREHGTGFLLDRLGGFLLG